MKGLKMNYIESLLSYDMDEFDAIQSNPDSFIQDIEKIIECYFSNNELSSSQIDNLTNNYNFQVELLKNIQQRMKSIITDSSTLLYKELVTVISLLSLGEKFAIFDQYNSYSKEEIKRLFRLYEKCMAESIIDNNKKFELLFNYYVTLLDAYNELCLINLTDVMRQKSIQMIVDAMTESINMLKFSVKLDEKKLEILNVFQGKLLINFSYSPDFDFDSLSNESLISKYSFYFNKISDGHYLASSFGSSHLDKLYALQTHVLLLSAICKLEQRDGFDVEELIPLMTYYEKEFHKEKKILEQTNIKELLLKEYIRTYKEELVLLGDKEIITYLLQEKSSGKYYEFISVLISFSEDMDVPFLIEVIHKLLHTSKLNNDYHEYFKLMILDEIINKIIQMNDLQALDKVYPVIEKYIKNFNIASHLMTAFSKIYLSMSLYYSLKGELFLKESQRAYFKSEKICSYTLIKHEYKNLYNKVLYNNALTFLSPMLSNQTFSSDEVITLGQKMMNDFFTTEIVRVYHTVNHQIEKIIEFIFTTNEYDKSKVINNVEQIISSEVLFGLAQCIIIDEPYTKSLDEVGYEYKEQELIENYQLIYKYSYTYKESFNMLYTQNFDYIRNKINSFIATLRVKKNMNNVIQQYLYDDDEVNIF